VVTDHYGAVHPTLPPYVPMRNRSKSPPSITDTYEKEHLSPIYKPIGNCHNQIQSHFDDEEDKSYYIGSCKVSGNPPVVTDHYGAVHPTLPPYVPMRNRSKSPSSITDTIEKEHLSPIYKPIGNSHNQIQSHFDDEEDKSFYIGSCKVFGNPPVVTDCYGAVHPTLPPYVPRRNRSKSPPSITDTYEKEHLSPIYKPIGNCLHQK